MPFTSPATQDNLSSAFVRGRAFICIRDTVLETSRIYELTISSTILTFTDVSDEITAGLPSPFTVDSVECIVSSYNYLILLTKSVCFWSSTTTPTDFFASLVSGAGFEFPGNLKGNITFGKEHSAGFFIYTSRNVIFAAYTGNPRYPWKFREVEGSGGFEFLTQVSGDTNTGIQFGVTITGQVQALSPDDATNIANEVSDFFERVKAYDFFDRGLNEFSLVPSTLRGENGQFSAYFFLDRYVILPYAIDDSVPAQYQYAIIYDSQSKRYGKLRLAYTYFYSDEESIFFVNGETGEIFILNFNIFEPNPEDEGETALHSGVILLGKFQYVRNRFLQMEEVELESSASVAILADDDYDFTRTVDVYLIPTFDGKSFGDAIPLTLKTPESDTLMTFPCHTTAKNFSLLAKGHFDFTSIGLIFTVHGKY